MTTRLQPTRLNVEQSGAPHSESSQLRKEEYRHPIKTIPTRKHHFDGRRHQSDVECLSRTEGGARQACVRNNSDCPLGGARCAVNHDSQRSELEPSLFGTGRPAASPERFST